MSPPRPPRPPARPLALAAALAAAVTSGLAACLAAGAPAAAAPGPGAAAAAPAGTFSMVETLRRLADQSDPMKNVILNDQRADLMRAALAAVADPDRRRTLRFQIGTELLRAGRTEEAITELEALRQELLALGAKEDAPGLMRLGAELGVAYLRLGEQANCIDLHASGSCIFPIRGDGVHRDRRGARLAFDQFLHLLELAPDDLPNRWLLNLAAMTLGEWPEGVPERWRMGPELFASDHPLPRFPDVAPRLGLDRLGRAGGSVVDDFDGDGHLDVAVTSWGPREQMRLYRNGGDGTFEDVTERSGLTGQVSGLNLVQADYDNDGDLDLLVLRGAWLGFFGKEGDWPNSLLRNDGGVFTDVTAEAGMLDFSPTQTAAWADFDGDGWLDLFVGNESVAGNRRPCRLYRSDRDGTFTEVAAESGVGVIGFVKGVVWGDYDNDGRPDLYVSRLGEPNLLFHNDGPAGGEPEGAGAAGEAAVPRPWRFTEVAERAGVTEPSKSFPAWFFDYDNDGWLDLFVAPFLGFESSSLAVIAADYLGLPNEGERPRLYRNRGDGTFEDTTAAAGLDRPMLVMSGNHGDLDNDGFPDFYLGTGEPSLATLVPKLMYRNDGGRRFQDVTTAGGFGHLQKGHGIAFADLDADGDQDVYITIGGAYSGDVYYSALFLNPGNPNHWITLRLTGTAANRSAIGARVRVELEDEGGGARTVHAVVGSGGSFGASSLQVELGLGAARAIRGLEVDWPGGVTQRFAGVPMDRFYRVRQGDAAPEPVEVRRLDLERAAAAPPPGEHAGHAAPGAAGH